MTSTAVSAVGDDAADAGSPRAVADKLSRHAGDARRPLYLNMRVKARVDADGPALRVRAAGRPETRYPLYRVSRVIATNRVDWSAAALDACLRRGIPIVIVAGDGALVGSVAPARVAPSRLAEDLEELLDRPDWREIYDNWLRASRMRLLADWRRERETVGDRLAPGEFTGLVRMFVYAPHNENPFGTATSFWRSAVGALAITVLRRRGIQPVYWGAGGTPLELLNDVSGMLQLRMWLEVRVGLKQALDKDIVALRVVHALSGRLDAECDRILASLARRVRQMLAEWR